LEIQRRFEALLSTSDGCSLPCWGGITPGKTSWEEASNIFSGLGGLSKPYNSNGDIIHSFEINYKAEDGYRDDEFNGINIIEKEQIVNTILLLGQNEASDPVKFQTLWEMYSPEKILKRHGPPTKVLLSTTVNGSGNTGNTGYILWLFFENQGIMIRYDGIVKLAPVLHICPRLAPGGDIYSIQLSLQSKDNLLPLDREDGILEPKGALIFPTIHTIEEAAQLKVDDFYKLFIQTDKPACFDTPSSIWP
jgi:hypothetical protein